MTDQDRMPTTPEALLARAARAGRLAPSVADLGAADRPLRAVRAELAQLAAELDRRGRPRPGSPADRRRR